MPKIELNLLPTMIGSMPYTDASKAMLQIIKYLPHIPAWPQLPHRDFRELMSAQYSEGFPGLTLDSDGNAVVVEKLFQEQLQKLYEDYLAANYERYAFSIDYAAGFQTYMQTKSLSPLIAKGQVTSPITFALTVKDENDRAILYDDTKKEAVCLLLNLKAKWQEHRLRNHSPNTLLFLDEPALSSFGSAYLPISEETVTAMLSKVLEGLEGLKGIHVCGGTNWEMLLKMTSLDVLNFDAYHFADNLQIYQNEVKKFWRQGKAIAWGIVPTDEKELKEETVFSLKDRLEEKMAFYTRGTDAISFKEIAAQSLLTPSCGLNGLSEEACNQALQILAELSDIMRRKYL